VTIAGPVRSWAIHVTQPVTRSMCRKGCLAYDSEHALAGPLNKLPTLHILAGAVFGNRWLGSGLIGHSQKMTVAASATAEKKTVGQRS